MERLPIDATMGERIRYYRQVAGLTQKALAEKCGITESAIRNYELGNRMPDWDTTAEIAFALEVHFFAIALPNLVKPFGALQALFQLEEIYGLHPVIEDGRVRLEFNESTYAQKELSTEPDELLMFGVKNWANISPKHRSGEMSDEEYQVWKSKYPNFAGPDGSLVGWLNRHSDDSSNSDLSSGKRFRREKKNK